MFNLYLFSFIIGGIFVSLSVISGLDGVNFDQDFDVDSDADFEIHLDSDIEITPYSDEDEEKERIIPYKKRLPWLPITSLKFWTFGFCFFGLTGLTLTYLNIASNLIFIISLLVGLICGLSMVLVLRNLRKHQANSLLKTEELSGLLGIVELPFDQDSKGKVRVNIKGSIIDFIAITEETKNFARGDKVLIVGRENNKVWVVSQNLLEDNE